MDNGFFASLARHLHGIGNVLLLRHAGEVYGGERESFIIKEYENGEV